MSLHDTTCSLVACLLLRSSMHANLSHPSSRRQQCTSSAHCWICICPHSRSSRSSRSSSSSSRAAVIVRAPCLVQGLPCHPSAAHTLLQEARAACAVAGPPDVLSVAEIANAEPVSSDTNRSKIQRCRCADCCSAVMYQYGAWLMRWHEVTRLLLPAVLPEQRRRLVVG
jgi:hypothetical protein